MLAADLNIANLSYDVHALLQAFYAGEQVAVLTPETGQKKREACGEPSIYVTVLDTVTQIVLKKDALRTDLPDQECPARTTGSESDAGDVPKAKRPDKEYPPQTSEPFSGAGETPQAFLEGRDAGQELQFLWKYEKEERASADWKHDFKAFLYQTLSQALGRQLPWGNLTGIRPTKISIGMLEEGRSDGEILCFLKDRHFLSEEKAQLCLNISKLERQILSGIHYKDGYSLYVGIPFCPTTCLYCSFTSYPIAAYRKQVDTYLDCLIREMDFVSEKMHGNILDSVYIGGGTPTTLEPEQLDRLITALRKRFDFSGVLEFTVEAGRADSITREKLEVLFGSGVTRISVNPQTMKEETLHLIGRRHTVEQVEEAFRLAREVGFSNINMDLILGLPGETEGDVRETIRRIQRLKPDSLTVHSLALKRASKLGAWIEQNDISMLKNTDETMEIARQGALSMDMKPYYLYRQKNMAGNFENVGYAREGCFGIYNILIMEEVQTIVALGAGSITKRVYPEGNRIERCENVKEVALYIEKIDEMIDRKRRLFGEV